MQCNKGNKELFIEWSGNTNESHQNPTGSGEMSIKKLNNGGEFYFHC